MRVAIGADHRGFNLKGKLLGLVERLGHEMVDVGAFGPESVDYPDVALRAAQRVAGGQSDRAILICGTGVGMCIAANKVVGVRAATCPDELTAELCRRHNDVNVLCLSADVPGESIVGRVVEVWLATEFEGGRHARRVQKITQFESQPG